MVLLCLSGPIEQHDRVTGVLSSSSVRKVWRDAVASSAVRKRAASFIFVVTVKLTPLQPIDDAVVERDNPAGKVSVGGLGTATAEDDLDLVAIMGIGLRRQRGGRGSGDHNMRVVATVTFQVQLPPRG